MIKETTKADNKAHHAKLDAHAKGLDWVDDAPMRSKGTLGTSTVQTGADCTKANFSLVPNQVRHLTKIQNHLLKTTGKAPTVDECEIFGESKEALELGLQWREGADKKAPNVDYTQTQGEVYTHYNRRGLTGDPTNDPTKAGVIEYFIIS